MTGAFRDTWAKALFSGELQSLQGRKPNEVDGDAIGRGAPRFAKEETQGRISSRA